MRSPSIRGRLFRFLGTGLVLTWLFVTVATSWVVLHETEENFDSGLQETAQRLLSLAQYELKISSQTSPLGIVAAAEHNEYLIYQVVNADRKVLLRSESAPEIALSVPLQRGFHAVEGRRFYVDVSADNRLYILVAEPPGHRSEAIEGVLVFMLIPLFAFLPIAALIIHLSVLWAERPVADFDREINSRSGQNLNALEIENLPSELSGVGKSVNQLLERLRLALDAERSFTAHSAHELRTPLAAAMAQLKVLQDELTEPTMKVRVGKARQMLDRLYQMSVKLLQLARAESGLALNVERFDLAELVHVLFMNFSMIEKSRLIFKPFQQGPVWAMGDIDAIGIALQNLVENAYRHGTQGKSITLEILPGPVIAVHNDCRVLSTDQLATLGQRFVRASDRADGFGLGLSIVQTIARHSGGSLELRSPYYRNGRGFCALLRLPAAD